MEGSLLLAPAMDLIAFFWIFSNLLAFELDMFERGPIQEMRLEWISEKYNIFRAFESRKFLALFRQKSDFDSLFSRKFT